MGMIQQPLTSNKANCPLKEGRTRKINWLERISYPDKTIDIIGDVTYGYLLQNKVRSLVLVVRSDK
jgi:hypothetical protein